MDQESAEPRREFKKAAELTAGAVKQSEEHEPSKSCWVWQKEVPDDLGENLGENGFSGLEARLQGVKEWVGGEEVEAEGVDHCFEKSGRGSQEREGLGAREGNGVKQRLSAPGNQRGRRRRGLRPSELRLPRTAGAEGTP